MHIPDGYLSPQTYIPLFGVFIAIAAVAVGKVKKEVSVRNVPYLGMAAAFSFIIMMFNLPIPGGTTGHAVGSAVIAILFGPWAATVAVSVAVIIQALVFGDGGITAIGANCFNMAVVGGLAGYGIYRLIAAASDAKSKRRLIAGAIAAYVSLNASALLAAVQLGIQPLIEKSPTGQPLYSPFPLSISIPAMALEHLLLFGFVEAAVTSLVLKYFQKNEPEMLG